MTTELRRRWAFFKMPLLWVWRGCFDMDAWFVAWTIAFTGRWR